MRILGGRFCTGMSADEPRLKVNGRALIRGEIGLAPAVERRGANVEAFRRRIPTSANLSGNEGWQRPELLPVAPTLPNSNDLDAALRVAIWGQVWRKWELARTD